jgi:predicted HicB family RNase H-like nuclease
MKQAQIRKPILNTSEALKFATEETKSENEYTAKAKDKIIAPTGLNPSENTRIFFAPAGDKRLTINIKKELHKKLKMAAIENETSVGEIIERLVQNNL